MQTLQDCEVTLSQFREGTYKVLVPDDVRELIKKFHDSFVESMSDDLHTTAVLDVLMEPLKTINGTLKKFKGKKQQQALIVSLLALEKEVKEVLTQLKDIALKRAGLTEEELSKKIEERTLARKNKQYEASDSIRKELTAIGIALMDEPGGTIWRPCEPSDE
ncbi:cysteine--tRNA ligase [Carex littledalei]|uniref:Cysteine--tRNA ligase n=1 Tax=Carex littledalei TaxID=544730 RepID=A0A833RA77_9POAL|nr:cysteine--tRNA ligase [Carex littledalei]